MKVAVPAFGVPPILEVLMYALLSQLAQNVRITCFLYAFDLYMCILYEKGIFIEFVNLRCTRVN